MLKANVNSCQHTSFLCFIFTDGMSHWWKKNYHGNQVWTALSYFATLVDGFLTKQGGGGGHSLDAWERYEMRIQKESKWINCHHITKWQWWTIPCSLSVKGQKNEEPLMRDGTSGLGGGFPIIGHTNNSDSSSSGPKHWFDSHIPRVGGGLNLSSSLEPGRRKQDWEFNPRLILISCFILIPSTSTVCIFLFNIVSNSSSNNNNTIFF